MLQLQEVIVRSCTCTFKETLIPYKDIYSYLSIPGVTHPKIQLLQQENPGTTSLILGVTHPKFQLLLQENPGTTSLILGATHPKLQLLLQENSGTTSLTMGVTRPQSQLLLQEPQGTTSLILAFLQSIKSGTPSVTPDRHGGNDLSPRGAVRRWRASIGVCEFVCEHSRINVVYCICNALSDNRHILFIF